MTLTMSAAPVRKSGDSGEDEAVGDSEGDGEHSEGGQHDSMAETACGGWIVRDGDCRESGAGLRSAAEQPSPHGPVWRFLWRR